MSRITNYILYIVLLSLLVGCRHIESERGILEINIDGNGRLPENVVGTWKADHGGWVFVFEPDGNISSATISLGQVTIQPGKTKIVQMQDGGESKFIPGIWTVKYIQEHRYLLVQIVIDSFRTELGQDVVRGSTNDVFAGVVSEDGTVWQAERYSYSQYIIDTDKYQNYELPNEPNDLPIETIIFLKDNSDN